ncbi:unnamed protein product [Meganyctiphanes norvegica]|uniref:Uncharacterized protein n=1 Tax=Meganyctiphanes norvegica TaxID=48144 RepID=A0AAV2SXI8_MEGNR
MPVLKRMSKMSKPDPTALVEMDPLHKEMVDRKVTPILAQLLTIPPGIVHHHDMLWLYNWLADPECSVEDFIYVNGDLGFDVMITMNRLFKSYVHGSGSINKSRIVIEALAVRCRVIEGPWERLAWSVIDSLESYSAEQHAEYGHGSSKLSNWVIRNVGDSELCPNPNLRHKMLLLYRTLVKIDDDNREKALVSLMRACSSLDRYKQRFLIADIYDIVECLSLFDEGNYLHQLDLKIAEKLKNHRNSRQYILMHDYSHEYAMGLRTLTDPEELQSIIALLKYASDPARMGEKSFHPDPENYLDLAANGLLSIVLFFKRSLQEPELLNVLSDSFMDVMEAVVIWATDRDGSKIGGGEFTLQDVENLLHEFCDEQCIIDGSIVDNLTPDKNTVGQEIIRRYKKRICKLRERVTAQFLDDSPLIYNFLYNDVY